MKMKDDIDLEDEGLEKQPRVCGMDLVFVSGVLREPCLLDGVSAAQEW